MDILGGIIAAVVGGIVGGLAGFTVARLQRTWDLDARQQEDRKARLRAAIDVVTNFMDAVEACQARRGMVPVRTPLNGLTNADRWKLASVLRLFPDVTSFEGFFYPPMLIGPDGKIGDSNIADRMWIPIRDLAGKRLAALTAQLEKLGDQDLRNLD